MVVLGGEKSEKSKLIFKFINNKFPDEHDAIVEDSYNVNISTDGKNHEFTILDTAGEDDYQTMLDEWIKSGDGFVIVFSVDDKEGFEALKNKYNRIKLRGKGNEPIFLVGNLKDIPENERKVSKNEAELMAKSLGIQYFEVSTTNDFNGNIKLVFNKLAEEMVKFKEKPKSKQSKNCYII